MDVNDSLLNQVSVIGSMLIDPKAAAIAVCQVQPEDFLSDVYRRLFLAIKQQFIQDQPVDFAPLVDTLKSDPSVDWYGLMRQCMTVTMTAANIEVYIRGLRDEASLSRINSLGGLLQAARNMDAARDYIAQLNGQVVDRPGVKITDMARGLADFMQRHRAGITPEYLPWGFAELDRRLYVSGGKFIIIGGYASHGKTAFALAAAWTMSEKYRVGFFSLETDDGTLIDRLVSRCALIAMPNIKRNELTKEDYSTIASVSQRMVAHKLEFVSASGMTVDDIFATAQSRHYEVIYIDYIQLIRGDRKRDRIQQVTEISLDLHTKTQMTGIPVIGLSQLSRAEKGNNGRRAPRMSDLRESGQLEQDADVIMMLHREVFDDPDSRRVLTVEKNKEGEVGTIYLKFDGETQTFRLHPDQTAPAPKKKSKDNFSELTEDDPDLPF